MEFTSEFEPLSVEDLPEAAAAYKRDGWRFVQMLGVNTEQGVDLIYSFMDNGGHLVNRKVEGVKPGMTVKSVTGWFLNAFVFENEAHDLFGVDIEGIAIDFHGSFYQLSHPEPMTIISPAQKAAREKKAKADAAKRAKAAKAAEAAFAAAHPEVAAASRPPAAPIEPSGADDVEERFAGMDPEKLLRVKAAIAAKAAKAEQAQAAKDAALEERLAGMDPEKAARVRAAKAAKAKRLAGPKATGSRTVEKDAELEAKLAQLDPERAAKVRAALDAQARKAAAKRAGKEGE